MGKSMRQIPLDMGSLTKKVLSDLDFANILMPAHSSKYNNGTKTDGVIIRQARNRIKAKVARKAKRANRE